MSTTVAESLIEQKLYDRTAEWNADGFTGKGVTVWDMESGNTTHGKATRKRVLDAAPDATVVNGNHCFSMKNGAIIREYVDTGNGIMSGEQFITANGISILTESVLGSRKPDRERAVTDYYRDLRTRYNLMLFNAAGNYGANGIRTGGLPLTEAMYVGACTLGKDGKPHMHQYSSIGENPEDVDFTTFVRAGQNGTSFASPYLAGIAAILKQRYGFSSNSEIHSYFRMVAEPIDTGHMSGSYDFVSGYGIPILPPVGNSFLSLEINSYHYELNGRSFRMDVAPFIRDSRTFVPVSFVSLAFGCGVVWHSLEKSVEIIKDGATVHLWIGKQSYLINGKPFTMDAKPFIQSQRTFVPVSFIAQALGYKTAWVEDKKKVFILEQK